MSGPMLLLVTALKLIAELALLALLGRWLLVAGLRRLAPQALESNVFLWLLDTLWRPFVTVAGWLTPRWVLRQHLPLVAFCLLTGLWLAATVLKLQLCLEVGLEQCR